LTVAGLIGLAVGAEIGRLADRWGPRDLFIALMVGQTLTVGLYVFVTGVLTLAVAATGAAICRQGAQAARGALIGQLGGAEAPVLRAYLHAVVNVGIAGGAALAGLAVARDTHDSYLALMLADAATFSVAAGAAVSLPRLPVAGRPAGAAKRRALRDRRFVVLTALSGVISLQFVVSGYLLPLWVVFHTDAPRWFASPLLLLNTAIIVALQVKLSRQFAGLCRAATAAQFAGLALAGGFALFGAAHLGSGAVLASLILTAAMIVASVGELFTLSAAFGISYGLAPDHAIGE
jgi:MFS family permease